MNSGLNEISIYNLLKKFCSDVIKKEELENLIRFCIRLCYSQIISILENENDFETNSDNHYKLTSSIVSELFDKKQNNDSLNLQKQLNNFYFKIEDESDAHYFLHRIINKELKQRVGRKYSNVSMLA
ncbi:MAG: hypothetical protein JEY94_02215 [Melioribacteraceae bacterium]|nr:hypothetical protein [Melioribacteraceae bacterium]